MTVTIINVFLTACVMSIVLTVLIRAVAMRIGFTDRPDGHRKLHTQPTALGGGLAVFLATTVVLGLLVVFPTAFREDLYQRWWELARLLLAGAAIVGVGLVDDVVGLRGRQKLLGQCAAIGILLAGGLVVREVGIFGAHFHLGWLAYPLTAFWLLGAINSLNLLDGIDGLASTLGLIQIATIALMAAMIGRYETALLGVAFAGALVGFIRFNFPPATIFLGDAGSMLIGLIVGTLAVEASLKGAGTVLLAAPLAIWAIPIFDSVAAILRRKLTGRSIYATDRGHLHHRLLDLLQSNRRVLALVACACAVTSAAALLSVFLKSDFIALIACASVVVIFIATGVFGRTELLLLGSRLQRLRRAFGPSGTSGERWPHQSAVRLQGTRPWHLLWDALIASAAELRLQQIRLDINMTAERESYHARWEQPDQLSREFGWRLEVPLLLGQQAVGHVAVFGAHGNQPGVEELQQLFALVGPVESLFLEIAGSSLPVAPQGGRAASQSELPLGGGIKTS